MLKNHSWTSQLTFGRLMPLLAIVAFPMALAFGRESQSAQPALQAAVKKRAINKLMNDFPVNGLYAKTDESTPELALASMLSHSVARKDVRAFDELDGAELKERKLDSPLSGAAWQSAKGYGGVVVITPKNYDRQVLDTEIVEVLTCNDDLAAVIYRSGLNPLDRPYATQPFCRSEGTWTAVAGKNFSVSVAAAEEDFGKRKGNVWQVFVKTKDLMKRGCDDIRARKYDEAIATCSEAIAMDPQMDGAFFMRGMAHFLKGDHDKAIADFTECLKRTPDLDGAAMCRYLRGLAHAGQKDGLDKARNDMMVAFGLDAPCFAERRVGANLICSLAFARDGRLDEALGFAAAAVQDGPEDADAYAIRGYVYEKHGDPTKAAADRETSRRLRAKTPPNRTKEDEEDVVFAKALHRCLQQLVPNLE
jgi:hypothetical protein